MLMPRKFYDEAGTGGGEGAETNTDEKPEGEKGKEADKAAEAAAKKEAGATKPEGKEGGESGKKEPTPDELKKSLSDRDAEIAKLKKKLGVQGNEIGSLKKFAAMLEASPEAVIANIASSINKKVSLGDTKADSVDLTKDSEFDGGRVLAAVNQAVAAQFQQFKAEFTPFVDKVQNMDMSARHEDYDDLSPDRKRLMAAVAAGEITWNEVFHLAAKGINSADAIKDAYEKGEASGIQKFQEQLDGSTGGTRGGGTRTKKSASEKGDLDHALGRLKRIRHN